MSHIVSPVNGEQIRSLYKQGGELERELWAVAHQDPFAEITRDQASSYNAYLQQAREVLTVAHTLQDADEEMLASDAHRALRGHLIPELERLAP